MAKKNEGDTLRSRSNTEEQTDEKDDEIKTLIEERRNIKKEDKEQMKNVSKMIKKWIRDKRRSRRKEKIQQIQEEFKGVKNFSSIKSQRKRTLIPKIKHEKGEVITSRKGIANVFGDSTSNSSQKISVMKRNRNSTRLI